MRRSCIQKKTDTLANSWKKILRSIRNKQTSACTGGRVIDMVRYHQAEQNNKDMLQLLDKQLIGSTSAKAKTSPRLRMNYNFHPSLDDKVQRFINCMEPGTKVEINHHPVDEMLIVIRGLSKLSLWMMTRTS